MLVPQRVRQLLRPAEAGAGATCLVSNPKAMQWFSLCAPVWFRSSRLAKIDAPPICSEVLEKVDRHGLMARYGSVTLTSSNSADALDVISP